MLILFRFCFLLGLKCFAALFWRFDIRWYGDHRNFHDIKLVLLLNHTSLYEPLFIKIAPTRWLWRMAAHGIFPGADKTMERPIVGRFFRLLARKPVTISRRRDHTWEEFKQAIEPESLIVMAPEGRMKRETGLDLHGKPMTVRGGVADILELLDEGRMLLLYSGGLHHIQVPGQLFPKPFRTIRAVLESVDIPAYKEAIEAACESLPYRKVVVGDLERRRDALCPANV